MVAAPSRSDQTADGVGSSTWAPSARSLSMKFS